MSWKVIFQDAVPSVASVTVYDKGSDDSMGRYVVAKGMKILPRGNCRRSQTDYRQRPAALAYAHKFLSDRATKAGLTYTIGDGRGTIMGFVPSEGCRPEVAAATREALTKALNGEAVPA